MGTYLSEFTGAQIDTYLNHAKDLSPSHNDTYHTGSSKRATASAPDEGRNIVLVWEDRGNPMKDSEGNIIYTDVLGQNGLLQCS